MTDLNLMGKNAVSAKYKLQILSTKKKNEILKHVAKCIEDKSDYILSENEKDIDKAIKNGMHPGMVDRLRLTKERIFAMSEGLLQIVALPDPIGEVLSEEERPNKLLIRKVRVPLGVIGIIYESRPNVTTDAFGLCFKSGNAVILKGGSDAICSNSAITKVIQDAIKELSFDENVIQLIQDTDREITKEFMRLNQYVDVLIPRGSAGLIRTVVNNSTIPVIETGSGNCHIYVDKSADLEMAIRIIINAKTQRIGVCNACESLVVHKDIEKEFLPLLGKALKEKNVEIRADREAATYIKDSIPATIEDFGTEYLDYIISVKTVCDVEEAISHINQYNTRHSEAIITQDQEAAEQFLRGVDAACVYVNASTRFTDGFEFGFGAEIGISTQKLHARGPMGLKELTSYQYRIMGDGQTRP